MTATKTASAQPRDFGLDVIRAFAILCILVTHSGVFFTTNFNPFSYGFLPLLGLLGVELFFGLSGYLIGTILLERRHSLGVFYLKRLMKILPPYLLILLIIFLLTGANNWYALVAHLLFVQNAYPDLVDFFPVSWSLAIEFWFYLLVPFLLLNPLAERSKGRQLLWLCIAVVALLLIARTVYVYALQPGWEFGVHRFIPLRFDTLVFGVIAAVIVKQHAALRSWLTQPWVVWTNLAFCVGLSIMFGALYYLDAFNEALWLQSAGLSALAFSIMLIVLAAQKYIRYPRAAWLGKTITFISVTSYSMYLLHLFIFLGVDKLPGDPLLLYVLALVASFVASWLFFITVERAALGLRDWMQKKWFARAPKLAPATEAQNNKQL